MDVSRVEGGREGECDKARAEGPTNLASLTEKLSGACTDADDDEALVKLSRILQLNDAEFPDLTKATINNVFFFIFQKSAKVNMTEL